MDFDPSNPIWVRHTSKPVRFSSEYSFSEFRNFDFLRFEIVGVAAMRRELKSRVVGGFKQRISPFHQAAHYEVEREVSHKYAIFLALTELEDFDRSGDALIHCLQHLSLSPR